MPELKRPADNCGGMSFLDDPAVDGLARDVDDGACGRAPRVVIGLRLTRVLSPAHPLSRIGRRRGPRREPHSAEARDHALGRPRIQCDRTPARFALARYAGRSPSLHELIAGHPWPASPAPTRRWPRARFRDRS